VPRTLRVALVGFGQVGRRFAEQLRGPYRRALRAEGVAIRVTGIATGRHGLALDPRGLDLSAALRRIRGGRSLAPLHRGPALPSLRHFVAKVRADVLVEVTPLDPRRGEPATTHVRLALRRGLHVITANKGPVAFALSGLRGLARRKRRLFLHEGAVMDGAPVFNLVERCLPGVLVLSFRGTLNSTTSLILSRMEDGLDAGAALREARALGIVEADSRLDLDGWDAAVKGCALARAFWDRAPSPARVPRRGISGVTTRDVRRAVRAGTRLRLVVRGVRTGRRVQVTVGPEPVPLGDPLAGRGGDAALVLNTDIAGEIGVVERGGTVDQTAYALLSDLLTIVRRTSRGEER
jgi:homoserine dehydrogenase